MPSLPLYDLNKKKVGSVELDDTVFAAEVVPHLLNSAVRYQVAKKHSHKTANDKNRAEITATRQKMYRQKGTGQARHGDAKAPIFVGGGKAHGPRERHTSYHMNKRARRSALITALSMLQKEDRLYVVKDMALEKHSTKSVSQCLGSFGVESALFVNGEEGNSQKIFNRSTKNLRNAKWISPSGVNVFDLLKYKNLLVSQKAVEKLTERLKDA